MKAAKPWAGGRCKACLDDHQPVLDLPDECQMFGQIEAWNMRYRASITAVASSADLKRG